MSSLSRSMIRLSHGLRTAAMLGTASAQSLSETQSRDFVDHSVLRENLEKIFSNKHLMIGASRLGRASFNHALANYLSAAFVEGQTLATMPRSPVNSAVRELLNLKH